MAFISNEFGIIRLDVSEYLPLCDEPLIKELEGLLINTKQFPELMNKIAFPRLNNWISRDKINAYCNESIWTYTVAACLSLGMDPNLQSMEGFPSIENLISRTESFARWKCSAPAEWLAAMESNSLEIYNPLKTAFENRAMKQKTYTDISIYPIEIQLQVAMFDTYVVNWDKKKNYPVKGIIIDWAKEWLKEKGLAENTIAQSMLERLESVVRPQLKEEGVLKKQRKYEKILTNFASLNDLSLFLLQTSRHLTH